MDRILINCHLPDLNSYINAERTNKYRAAKMKKEATANVCWLAKQSKVKINYLCDIRFVWHKPDNRKDHDNICFAKKFILDGLVDAGVLKNDNPKHVWDFQDTFFVDKKLKRVVCLVEFFRKSEIETCPNCNIEWTNDCDSFGCWNCGHKKAPLRRV